jgi:hypothetical protein
MRVPLAKMYEKFQCLDDILFNLGFFVDKTKFSAECPPEDVEASAKYNYFPATFTESHRKKTVPKEAYDFVIKELRSLENIVSKYHPITELARLDEDDKDEVIEAIQASEHNRYLKGPKVRVETILEKANEKQDQYGEVHITKLSKYLAKRLRKLGIRMGANSIRDAFKPFSGTDWLPRKAYHFVRKLPKSVYTQRVPTDDLIGRETPSVWMYKQAERYQFKSARYMLMAVAEKTGLNATSIGSMFKHEKIPLKLYECFLGFEEAEAQQKDIGAHQYRVVPMSQFADLLRNHGTEHTTYKDLFETLSPELDLSVGTLRLCISNRPNTNVVSMQTYLTAQSYILNNQKV